MRAKDPEHWLYRFSAEEWLQAAENELGRAAQALETKQHRAGVTQALRAAGMAWNAVLVTSGDETGYGRSYRDHLDVLARDPSVPESVRQAAQTIAGAPLSAQVVALGRGDVTMARHAAIIIEHARLRTLPTASA